MQIIDLNNKPITVTNLEEAIKQADLFRGFRHVDPAYKFFDEQNSRYWHDFYLKLLELKKGGP